MNGLEKFTRHYLKISNKTFLTPKEKLHVRQLYEFLESENVVPTKATEVVRCPCCDTEFVVPKDELVEATS